MRTEQKHLGTIWYGRISFAILCVTHVVFVVRSFSERIDPGQIDLLYFALFAFLTVGGLNRAKHLTNMLERRGGRVPAEQTPPQG